ncbi:type ISP restriction/modification enzyme [Spirosoma jeollabukense]
MKNIPFLMSTYNIHQYYTQIEKSIHYGGSKNERSIRRPFEDLINSYAIPRDLLLIPELDFLTPFGKKVTPDGTLKDALRLDWGYWESKDTNDDLGREIERKFAAGYPNSNILFEDSQTAILFRQGSELGRCPVQELEPLHHLLTDFVSYTRPEVKGFRQALEQLKSDLPQIARTLREMIDKQNLDNSSFKQAQTNFLSLCKESINIDITSAEIDEMLIQHILTEDIFVSIFDDTMFHQENNISKELQKLENTFFTGNVKRATLNNIKPYYSVIKSSASQIADHKEKKHFLKVMYENFYKAYNPKAADKLGIVYTPNEIVKFMVDSTDYLLYKHFNKFLESDGVEILDPATGTGTFISDILEHLPKNKLVHKYKNEIHCNEVSILPYYIANLNIEATFKQKMGYYEEYPNICFVDTLDNIGFGFSGKQTSLFGSMSAENAERVKAQNARKISVIIGNPPYNAKQENYNYQNANRTYKQIDKRIKDTFIKNGTAQNQIVVYDMYTRFYRWAMDRINDNGIIAFITNRSFIDSRSFDGFRKSIQEEYTYAYIIDTKSDVRANPKISGTKNNVFGIQTGVAIMFLIKQTKERGQKCQIRYTSMLDEWTRKEKLSWFDEHHLKEIDFDFIIPDAKQNWINQSENDFETLLPIIDKRAKGKGTAQSVFKLFTSGIKTQRDEWVYDFNKEALSKRMAFFIDVYNLTLNKLNFENKFDIKWDRELEGYLKRRVSKKFEKNKIITSLYRPFIKQHFYFDKHFNGMTYQWIDIYSSNQINYFIAFNTVGNNKDFHCLGTDKIIDLHATGDSQCLPLYRYDGNGNRLDNITDWGLQQFIVNYKDDSITKEAIFHYTYAVLHHPEYRTKYGLNLKREFPRLPFYTNFDQWVIWGKALMDLHIKYETVTPYALERREGKPGPQQPTLFSLPIPKTQLPQADTPLAGKLPKVYLKTDKSAGAIIIDELTTLTGVPAIAWEYKLGNRSALEWVLDQYKEKKPSDPTIAAKFNTYRFADYKEHVIDLLQRVCTVSVETMKVIDQMPKTD